MSHYFTNDNIDSKEVKTKCVISDYEFSFITDNGVFSKRGLDFGTRSLLLSLKDISGDVLDFGCGYGPIGIFLKKKFDCNVDMIDINKRAIGLAIKNAALNNVSVNVFSSNIYDSVTKKYDFIITNPPIRVGKKILHKILFDAKKYLKENGKVFFVIHKDQGAKTLAKVLEKEYKVEIVDKNKGFYVICLNFN
jgi:16S rRNA (guanine1207-N2)-methyltransferase